MMLLFVVLAAAAITISSRVAALALLPAPPEALSGIIQRLPAPLFAALAALSLMGDHGSPPAVPMLVAAGCAVISTRWNSLLVTLGAGLGGFLVASVVLNYGADQLSLLGA